MSGHLPSEGWTLTYRLKRGDVIESFSATAGDNDEFVVNVPASTTDDFAGGRYQLVGRVTRIEESGAEPEVYTVYFGHLEVLADPAGDGTTHSERMVAKLEAAIEARVEGTAAGALRRWREGNVEEEYSEDLKGLLGQLGYYYEKVRQERGGRQIQTMRGRFVHPG